MNVRGHLLRKEGGLTIGFGLDLSKLDHIDREVHLVALERIFAAERVPIFCFESKTVGKNWAHVYARDDLEHHTADVYIGPIGRDDRPVTLREVNQALAMWCGRESDTFDTCWGGVDGEERAYGAS